MNNEKEDDRKGQNTARFGHPPERPRHEFPVKPRDYVTGPFSKNQFL
ncbi:hypothetical protein J2S09_001502 [Bacillus fengqiuensis]|nr:hypothetical protein [Bacillus fengqiuensis]